MRKRKVNGREYDIPTSWRDVSMKDYCRYFKGLNMVNDGMSDDERRLVTLRNEGVIVSRVLNEPDDFALSLPIGEFGQLENDIMFMYDIKPFLDSRTFVLKIDGRKYMMPEVNEMSLRQFIDSDIIMRENEGDENQFLELLACLLVPMGDDGKRGEYDGNYMDLMLKLGECSAEDCLPFIYTFFKKKEILSSLSSQFSEVLQEAERYVESTKGS